MTGKLLVDDETGRVLRADDTVEISERVLGHHDFMTAAGYDVAMLRPQRVFAGPEALRAQRRFDNHVPVGDLDIVVYEVHQFVGGQLTIQRIEEPA